MLMEDLVRGDGWQVRAPAPVVDALSVRGALAGAQLIEVRMDMIRSFLWLLFDLRGAIDVPEGNTALIQVERVAKIAWSGVPAWHRWAWMVGRWEPCISSEGWTLTSGFEIGGELAIKGRAARYLVGNIEGGDLPPPDFTESTDEEILAGFATWRSLIEVAAVSGTFYRG
ncbi:hypothetical protein [Sphaerimonospora mesophila]|uniref:hypothetical protein n=1 Tax=Sphaerimonospora mesophila TaxID=37483 RepID=UPI00128F21C5